MVMQDNPEAEVTYVLNRGQYDQPIKEGDNAIVNPGVPAILPKLRNNAPGNRLGLANWLVDPSHPLTARVAVNRYWAMFFGRGIVKTPDDFGNRLTPNSSRATEAWQVTLSKMDGMLRGLSVDCNVSNLQTTI